MAHEIVHYQENHLQKSYNQSKEASLDPSSTYQDLVMLSKDHEFEADIKALKLYHAAGYSEKESSMFTLIHNKRKQPYISGIDFKEN